MRSQSAFALLLMLPAAILGPAASQAIVLHEHGDITEHAHRVARVELSNWQLAHANQHSTWSPEQVECVPLSQDAALALPGTGTAGNMVLVDPAYVTRPSNRSTVAATARPSVGISTVDACSSDTPLRAAFRLTESRCDSPGAIAPSRVAAILRTNHTLLV